MSSSFSQHNIIVIFSAMLSILQAGIRYSHFPEDRYNPGRQYKQKWQKCQKKKKYKVQEVCTLYLWFSNGRKSGKSFQKLWTINRTGEVWKPVGWKNLIGRCWKIWLTGRWCEGRFVRAALGSMKQARKGREGAEMKDGLRSQLC